MDKIIVSTDSDEITAIARQAGVEVPFRRPPELATDEAPKLPVIQHAVRHLLHRGEQYDFVLDLDPTSPLRLVADIEGALQLFRDSDANNLYSVCPARRNPYFNMVELDEKGRSRLSKQPAREISSRQTAPKVYELNASIYLFRTEYLMCSEARLHSDNTLVYVMPEERSVDIDTPRDFKVVELLLAERHSAQVAQSII